MWSSIPAFCNKPNRPVNHDLQNVTEISGRILSWPWWNCKIVLSTMQRHSKYHKIFRKFKHFFKVAVTGKPILTFSRPSLYWNIMYKTYGCFRNFRVLLLLRPLEMVYWLKHWFPPEDTQGNWSAYITASTKRAVLTDYHQD